MEKYLTDKFGSNIKEMKLVDESSTKWGVGIILGNKISKVGLMANGVKPKYYLIDEKYIIRYTIKNYDKIEINSYDVTNKQYVTKRGNFILV